MPEGSRQLVDPILEEFRGPPLGLPKPEYGSLQAIPDSGLGDAGSFPKPESDLNAISEIICFNLPQS
jgi:hypothetical protein